MMNSASKGEKALESSDFPSAIQHFTRALGHHPRSPTYYIKRSIANCRLKPADGGPHSKEALKDAEIAVCLARERGRHEVLMEAQFRRGVALFQLQRYADAGYVFGFVNARQDANDQLQDRSGKVMTAISAAKGGLSTLEKEASVWSAKVGMKLKGLDEGDDRAVITVTEYPADVPELHTVKELMEKPQSLGSDTPPTGKPPPETIPTTAGPASTDRVEKPHAVPPVAKVRHEWYQSNDAVVLALYVKGVPKTNVDADLKADNVCYTSLW